MVKKCLDNKNLLFWLNQKNVKKLNNDVQNTIKSTQPANLKQLLNNDDDVEALLYSYSDF